MTFFLIEGAIQTPINFINTIEISFSYVHRRTLNRFVVFPNAKTVSTIYILTVNLSVSLYSTNNLIIAKIALPVYLR